jgi:hypothetical protein
MFGKLLIESLLALIRSGYPFIVDVSVRLGQDLLDWKFVQWA